LNGGGRNGSGPEQRKAVRCVVPRELEAELYDRLSEHWEDDPSIRVVIERRRRDRRRGQRRREDPATPPGAERRRIRARDGLRVGERRTATLIAMPPEFPPYARRHAERVLFYKCPKSTASDTEDEETILLLLRAQSGDMDSFGELYKRNFDGVYAYARVALCDAHEAEDVTQQVFANVMRALPRYEVRRDSPFKGWLFRIARNAVLRALAQNGRFETEEPMELDRRLESPTPEVLHGLEWLSDHQLAFLVERLPLAQRQVIVLRYGLDYSTDEIAEALERTPVAIRMLEHRAMRMLEQRLSACRKAAERSSATPTHSPMMARVRSLPVTSSRRIALEPFTRALGLRRLRIGSWRR
jgi:RNA polymerase sigma-70 factor (ECF subfamily)